MNVAKLRGFLLQKPKPHVVRVTGDGEPQEIRPGRSYVKCAETIAAIGGDLLECLDEKGNLLRALRMSDPDLRRSDAAEIPSGISADPNALMLTHLANLVHRAYEHSTEIAFTKMVEIFEKMNERSESIEQRLERTEAQNRRLFNEQAEAEIERAHEQAEQAGANGGDMLNTLASSFLSGQMQRATATPTNGKAKD